jgi:hypothetical protein
MAFQMQADLDRLEAMEYRPGQRVELKQCPGKIDEIAEYDPMMVPPIWLVNDPQPRYPEELNLLPAVSNWFGGVTRTQTNRNVRGKANRARQKALR